MAKPESTRWSLIKKAAQGIDPDREDFARVYEAPARAYFTARWRSTPLFCDADDAVQEVLLDCLKEGGALTRVDADRPGGFRAYFYGILRTTALRFERTRARRHEGPQGLGDEFGAVPADEAGLSTAFDRVWGLALLREAVERHRETAEENGPAAQRRFEILRLRFDEGIPIREIAARWGEDAETLHNEQRQAKREFREALYEVVRLHYPASDDVAEECRKILATLA